MGDEISQSLRDAADQAEQWEYLAHNLKKVPGISLENDFNKRGAEGWEFVAVADGYAIFKRRPPPHLGAAFSDVWGLCGDSDTSRTAILSPELERVIVSELDSSGLN